MKSLGSKVIFGALILLSMGAGLWLSQSIWRIIQPPQPSLLWPQWGNNVISSPASAAPLSQLRPTEWFGTLLAPATVLSVPVIRVTELPLALHGVLAHVDPIQGSALIAQRGQDVSLFRPGDRVFDVAELIAVYHDSVILERAGQQEILRFETNPFHEANETTANLSSTPTLEALEPTPVTPTLASPNSSTQPRRSALPNPQIDAQAAFADRLARDIEQGIAEVRTRAQTDPQGLLAQYGLAATENGYEVTPNAMILISNGLQLGDRITEINGQPVGNITQDQQRVDAVLAQSEIQLTLVRGTQVFRFTQALRGF